MKEAHEIGSSPRALALMREALSAVPARLDLAALAIAAVDDPQLDVDRVLGKLSQIAEEVREEAEGLEMAQRVEALRRVLGEKEGFTGDAENYDAPENSSLVRVLERRRGLPITLSVLYCEVARRADIPLYGVAFPAHFVTGIDLPDGSKRVLDPFHAGELLDEQGAAELLRRVAPGVKFSRALIAPASVRTITQRMLNNLKRGYLERGQLEQALTVVNLLLELAPDDGADLRVRAAVLIDLGATRAALADVERCLALAPDSPDAEELTRIARELRERTRFPN